VIDIAALRKLVESGELLVVIDAAGVVVEDSGTQESGPALLIAAPVTEAVKVVNGGLVHDSVDRDTLWSVENFVLGPEVVMALDEGVITPGELIEAVISAGFEWRVINPSSSSI